MDHKYIEEQNIIARYEMGKLPAAESVLFEEHFADCPSCQQAIENAADFRGALKKVVAEDTVVEKVQSARGRLVYLPAVQNWRPMLAAVAACFILLSLPTILTIRHLRDLDRELNQAKSNTETLQRQYEQEHQAALALQKQLDEASQKSEAVGTVIQPALASIFTLNMVRSADDSEPANQVAISHAQPWIVLSIDQDEIGDFQNYRITLQDSAGKTLWTKSDIRRVPTNSLGITIPSSLFHAGNYLLVIEGLSPKGYIGGGRYPFHFKFRS